MPPLFSISQNPSKDQALAASPLMAALTWVCMGFLQMGFWGFHHESFVI
jgi:hypothetical protein